MEENSIRIAIDSPFLTEVKRIEALLNRRYSSLRFLKQNLSDYSKKIYQHINAFTTAQESMHSMISSGFNSTQARLQSLAIQVDTEILRISDMIAGRSDIDDSYIDKLQDGDIRSVLDCYEELSSDTEYEVSNHMQDIYSELFKNSQIYVKLKKEVENLNLLVEEHNASDILLKEKLKHTFASIYQLQYELNSKRYKYKYILSEATKRKNFLTNEVERLHKIILEQQQRIDYLCQSSSESESKFLSEISACHADSSKKVSDLTIIINSKFEENRKLQQQIQGLEDANTKLLADYKDKEIKLSQECTTLKEERNRLQEELKNSMRVKDEASNSILEDKLKKLQASYNMLYEKKEAVDRNLEREINERKKAHEEIMRIGRAKDEEEMKYKQRVCLLERKSEEYKSQIHQAREDENRYKSQVYMLEVRLKEVEANYYQPEVEDAIVMQQGNRETKIDETRSGESFQFLVRSIYERFNEMLEQNPPLVLLAISLVTLFMMQAFYYIIHN